jgi:spermidine synthase
MSRLLPVVYTLFFISGGTALIYEVVWARMLTQIFGNTTHAIATVLSAFMAGLALGSYLLGRVADAPRNALFVYGLLEAGVGVYGLAIPFLFALTQSAYTHLYGLADVSFALFSVILFALCFAVILVPTALMGATLPMLSRFCVTHLSTLGQRIGDLYAVNTFGAVVGCALTGFALIPELGLRGSVRLAATLNLVIAAVVVGWAGWLRERGAEAGTAAEAVAEPPAAARSRLDVALLLAFGLSGAAAMVYESAWTRALTLVIGMSTYSFTIMLTTFLVGLGTGSLLYARWWGRRPVGVSTFGLLQLGIALSALATIPLFERLPFLFLRLRLGFGDSFQQYLAIQVALSALVMIIPTLLLGATFPMVTRLYTQSVYRVGSSVGTAYASNTLGAILGAFLGGFVLIPALGVQNSIGLAVMVSAAGGVLLVALDDRVRRARRRVVASLLFGVSLVVILSLRTWDTGVMTSGVTIYAHNYASLPSDGLRREWMERDELLYYREGLTATISVHRQAGEPYVYEKTNGKVDASFGDTPTQLMIGYLPMLFRPEAKQVLVIGMGSGMTAKAVAAFPVERLEIAEIEPAVIEGARFFAEKNGRIHDDPRVRFVHADGRNYLVATPAQFDVIISEPSNPWIAGIGNLFTREYYQLAARKLREGGVFGQWMQTYAMAPEDLRMVFRTFAEVFPDVSLWAVNDSDLLLIGTLRPQRLRYASLRAAVEAHPAARQDLAELGFKDAYSLLAMYRMPKPTLLKMAAGAEVNLDDFPRLEFLAPRNLGRDTSTLNSRLTRDFVVPPEVEDASPTRDPGGHLARFLAHGYRATRDRAQALEWVERSLRLNPGSPEARLLRARLLVEDGRPYTAAEESRRALRDLRPPLAESVEVARLLEPGDAVALLREIRQRDPELREARVALADALRKDGRHAEAAAEFEGLRPLLPKDPRIPFGLGRALMARGEYAAALDAFDAAGALGERSGDLSAARADALMWLGRHRQAIPSLRAALRTQVENVTWRLNLGIALATLGPEGRAEAELRLREVLAMDAGNTRAWTELQRLGARF